MTCMPCERTFEHTVKLLILLQGESLISPETRAQARVVYESIKLTGEYLVDKKIREAVSARPAYREDK